MHDQSKKIGEASGRSQVRAVPDVTWFGVPWTRSKKMKVSVNSDWENILEGKEVIWGEIIESREKCLLNI